MNLYEEKVAGSYNMFEKYRSEELKILIEIQNQRAALKMNSE